MSVTQPLAKRTGAERDDPDRRATVSRRSPIVLAAQEVLRRAHRLVQAHASQGVLQVAVLVVAAAVRLWRIDQFGFNSDEAVYAGQSASLAGNPRFVSDFAVFRAHPLLFQTLLSPLFRSGVHDVSGRLVSVAFGVGTVALVSLLGRILYGPAVGLFAALLLALMPYHVTVSRQVLLDGPMTFFVTLSLVALAWFATHDDRRWLLAAAGALGLAILTKETAAIFAGSIYAFLALDPHLARHRRPVVIAALALLGLTMSYPLITAFAGGTGRQHSYLAWQLARRSNHTLAFYLESVPPAMGIGVVALALGGLWLLRRQGSWREVLLCSWVVVPFVFFELWPVKGFQYLIPLAPAMAVLAARTAVGLRAPYWWGRRGTHAARLVAAVIALTLVVPMLWTGKQSDTFVAGGGGLPGGRETGRWLQTHVPANARILTLGPSMANIIEYYSGLRCRALSVSPNPLHRNPAYEAVPNPDAALRSALFQYVVWDAFSARRSPHFARTQLALVGRYHGRAVHTERAPAGGGSLGRRLVVVYQVRP